MINLEELYSREYYLEDCEGFQEFQKNWGQKPSRRLTKCLRLLSPAAGEKIADLGCGRGEVAIRAAACGAHVVAVDGSPVALQLLQEASQQWIANQNLDINGSDRLQVVHATLDNLPLKNRQFDAVVMSDVIEHIPRPQIGIVLQESFRILRPGGRLIIHTQPNRLLVDWTVPLLSHLSWLWGVRLPADLRDEMTAGARGDYHPSEQSRGELRRHLQNADFVVDEIWLEGTYPLHRIFRESRCKDTILKLFRRSQFLKEFLAGQIYATCHRPH